MPLFFDVYVQDPLVAAESPEYGFETIEVFYDPQLGDGPTSARFAVVDYNAATGEVGRPAVWDEEKQAFKKGRRVLDRNYADNIQFHQVNVWATLQRALEYYEDFKALGRRIPWGFEGNRLIVVPHAGYGKNAYYDRQSKSLQFYYYLPAQEASAQGEAQLVFTCLSADIIHHEFGHAILDGIRPYYIESHALQTAAFHEFMGDFTAVMLLLRNNDFRNKLADEVGANLGEAEKLFAIAEQFGQTVTGRPYLRAAKNELSMDELPADFNPHLASEIMTGTMFEVLIYLANQYRQNRGASAANALWYTIDRMQRTAIQPLDLLPPVDVSFRDYALAVLRMEELRNPKDPYNYYQTMLEVFIRRKILNEQDREALLNSPRYLLDRLELYKAYRVESFSKSKAATYRFLHLNREQLFIPRNRDLTVADVYISDKLMRQGLRFPRHAVIQYIWREEVLLEGNQFGELEGSYMSMLCGGTLVLDMAGNVLSWMRKAGTQLGDEMHLQSWYRQSDETDPDQHLSEDELAWRTELEQGVARRQAFLQQMAALIQQGKISLADARGGLLAHRQAPLVLRREGGAFRPELQPHFHLSETHQLSQNGKRTWEISF
ncbi:MAG: serine protease [Bacteroidetes bacterium]|nr:MAG: serine protease [Bacteroidota bacterium]